MAKAARRQRRYLKNPALAKTLRLIGEKGRDAFYKGEIADKIDMFMQQNGGFLRKADFESIIDMGRSRLDELSRLRRLGVTAERSGHRDAPNLEHSRGIRPTRDGSQFTRHVARHGRSEENCLGRSCEILRGSGVR